MANYLSRRLPVITGCSNSPWLITGLLALIGLLASCAQQPHSAPSPTAPAEQVYQQLEQHLLTIPELRLHYRIEAEGAFDASLSGELLLRGESDVMLSGAGTFGGAPMSLRLVSEEGQLRGESTQQPLEGPTPAHLRSALVLGLTRMGLLHNLARLSAGRSPDHAHGGVDEWVQPRQIEWLPLRAEGEPAQRTLAFLIEVAGQTVADAELDLDPRGHPVRRRQVVRFPGGEMRVHEEYTVILR